MNPHLQENLCLKPKVLATKPLVVLLMQEVSAFEMQASKVSEDSQYAKIVQLVRKAQEEKAPIQRLADKYALWFTPITLAISGLGWLITQNPQTILISACCCYSMFTYICNPCSYYKWNK